MKKINSFSIPSLLEEEPWVKIPSRKDLKDWKKFDEIKFNQQNRQIEKYKMFIKTFDFLTENQIFGDYFEFGCHRCRTFRMVVSLAYMHQIEDMNFYAFDSFDGLPELENSVSVKDWKRGSLTTSQSDFMRILKKHGLNYNKITPILKKHKLHFLGLRPNKLSKDNSLTKDVVLYELNKFQKKFQKKYSYILLLQPTTPIRSLDDIKNAIKLINNKKKKYDSVVSIKNVDGNHPLRMKKIKNGYLKNYIDQKKENMIPRQKLPKVYIRSGSFYLIKKNQFLKYNSLVGNKTGYIILKNIYSLNIDTIEDLIIFENYCK